jgi:anti-sigma-K factor RskA
MPDDCEHWHRVIAERALRQLDAATELGVSRHMAACAESRALARDFGATAAALASASEEARVLTPSISGDQAISADQPYVPSPERFYAQITSRLAASRNRRRRLTWAVATASAAVLVGIFVMAITMSPSRPPTASRVAFTNETVDGVATFESKTWGTEIHLRARGFTPGQQYNVWLERADGTRVGAGTFTGVTHPPVIVTLSSALAESHAVAIGISQPDGTMVMRRSLT